MTNNEGFTNPISFSVKQIVDALKGEGKENIVKIVIPKFQRNLRWDSQRKKKLIDSIKNGYPIGALLLFKDINKSNNEYRLIDGLQRASTLKEHLDNQTQYFNEDEIGEELIKKVTKIINSSYINENTCKARITEWIKNTNPTDFKNYTAHNLIEHIISPIKRKPTDSSKVRWLEQLPPILSPFLEQVKNDSDIENYKVAVIEYTGSHEDLPTIFELINKQGVLLSKYEMFAASWSEHKPIKINNKSIKSKIQEKYDFFIEKKYEIDGYKKGDEIKDFSYFEFFMGLGKYIRDKFSGKKNYLFISKKNKDDKDKLKDESLGFNLSAICLGLTIKQIGKKLPNTFKLVAKNNTDLFIEKLENAIDETENILEPFISFGLNQTSNTARIQHAESQIIAIIATVFQLKNNINNNLSSIKGRLDENKRKDIIIRYLYDIIRGHWSGQSYDKITQYVIDLMADKKVKFSDFNSVMDNLFEQQLEKKEKSRRYTKATYIILKYIYSNILTVRQDRDKNYKFEIEHIVPFQKLQDNFPEGISINNIANLCLIPKSINNSKSAKTIYEYADTYKGKKKLPANFIRNQEIYFLTTKDDLEFCKSRKTIKEEDYFKFLKKRIDFLKAELFKDLDFENKDQHLTIFD